jgi:glycosyltransferase involved in cell wall biosynthesis
LSLLAIPSVWLETGPLTLLEALQAGVPVYGSARIGQRGCSSSYGRVIEPNTPARLGHARWSPPSPRSMSKARWKRVCVLRANRWPP